MRHGKWTAAALMVACLAACRESEVWIRNYGFVPIRPPSTLLAPGAIVMKHGSGNAATRLVCSAEESLGLSFVPSKSRTITGKFTRKKSLGWNLSADMLSQVKASTNATDVSDVFVEVKKARIVNVSDADVMRWLPYRSRACSYAMARRLEAGYELSFVRSALIADVEYRVSFQASNKLDVEAKIQQVQNVSVALGGNIESSSETSASASGLVFGIKDDTFLAAIGSGDADVRKLRRRSVFANNEVLERKLSNQAAQRANTPLPADEADSDAADGAQWSSKPIGVSDADAPAAMASAPADSAPEPVVDVSDGNDLQAELDDDTGYPG